MALGQIPAGGIFAVEWPKPSPEPYHQLLVQAGLKLEAVRKGVVESIDGSLYDASQQFGQLTERINLNINGKLDKAASRFSQLQDVAEFDFFAYVRFEKFDINDVAFFNSILLSTGFDNRVHAIPP